MPSLPIPPPDLRERVAAGGSDDSVEAYERLGRAVWEDFRRALPEGWALDGKRVLDFGCGAGRVLRHLVPEAPRAELWGCDIDRPSVMWLEQNLSPPLHVFVNGERPPLPHASGTFDLIYAASVFTQLVEEWSAWLLELHRLLADDGLLVTSFINTGLSFPLEEAEWHDGWDEDRIGMHTLNAGASWDEGGPVVYHSIWWIEAHWGRAFELLHVQPAGLALPPGSTSSQGFAVMRKRPGRFSRQALEALEPGEPREVAALEYSLRNSRRETGYRQGESRHFARLLDSERDRLGKKLVAGRRKLKRARRRSKIEKRRLDRARKRAKRYRGSLSWRLTGPLRALLRRSAPLRRPPRGLRLSARLPSPTGGLRGPPAPASPRAGDDLERELRSSSGVDVPVAAGGAR